MSLLVPFTNALRAVAGDAALKTQSYNRVHPSFMAAFLRSMQVPGVPDVLPYGKPMPPAPAGAYDVNAVGPALSGIFATGGAGDRTHSGVSAAGVVWEGSVSDYLNMLTWDSGFVALSGSSRRYLPTEFVRRFDTFKSVDGRYRKLSSDLDILGLDFEEVDEDLLDNLVAPCMPPETLQGPAPLPERKRGAELAVQRLLSHEEVIEQLGVVHVAVKTNFNDLIQAPALWALIYNEAAANGNVGPMDMVVGDIRGAAGTEEWPEELPGSWRGVAEFRYLRSAFVTVPTQKKAQFSLDTMPVLRASIFDAGAFWGRSTLGISTVNSLDQFPYYALGWRHGRTSPSNNAFGKALSDSQPTDDVRVTFHLG